MAGFGSLLQVALALAAFTLLCRYYWLELAQEDDAGAEGWFLEWAAKGLGCPLLLWAVVNSGLLPHLPSLVPALDFAVAKGRGSPALWLEFTAPGFVVIGAWWAAVSCAWMLALTCLKMPDRREFAVPMLFWGVLLSPVGWLVYRGAGISGLAFALLAWFVAVLHFTAPLVQLKKLVPCYSGAIAKVKFGKYGQAEAAVLRELEKNADDFDGWLMLADLYANHFNDLSEADRTIRALCGQPNVAGVQVALAFHRLADWYLKLADEPAGARRAMEEICQRLPGSPFAREARQRLARLPASRAELRQQRQPKTIRLPALREELDNPPNWNQPKEDPDQAAAFANACVEKLKHNPNDVAARETLATTLAERLGKVEPALEQLELLLGMAEPPAAKPAEWLGLMAAWLIRYRQDWAAAKPVLERLVHDYPQTPQAFAAQRRLCLMEVEARSRSQ
jgi:hypothetical protein